MALGDSVTTNKLRELLAQQVENNRADLTNLYIHALRETLFTNRSEMHPRELSNLAQDELTTLLSFLRQTLPSSKERGVHLCEAGLSEQTVLRLAEVTRQFFLSHLEPDQVAPAITLLDGYQSVELLAFIKRHEDLILEEQERIRSALQLAISRYTVEIKEIQDIAQKASEANQFKSQFIARISHELRTPVGALMGMAEMLHQDVYGKLAPRQQEITKRIVTNAQTLKQVFAELLDQSQIESGQLRLKAEAFSPEALVESVNANYLPLALQKGLSLHVEIGPGLPKSVIGDRARVEQILSNLVINAIKFTQSGGIIVLLDKQDSSHWSLQVKDTGMGISKENLTQIFEPFHKVDENTVHELGGVGLGLSIVQQLVSVMHGTVHADSKIGQGSSFIVILPIIPE